MTTFFEHGPWPKLVYENFDIFTHYMAQMFGDAADETYIRRAADRIFSAMIDKEGKRRTPSKFAERLRAEARRFKRLEDWRGANTGLAAAFAEFIYQLANDVSAGVAGRPRGATSSHTPAGRKWAKRHVHYAVSAYDKHVCSIGREDLVGEILRPGVSSGLGQPIKPSWGRRLLFKAVSLARARFGGHAVSDKDIKWAIADYYRTYSGPVGYGCRTTAHSPAKKRPVN